MIELNENTRVATIIFVACDGLDLMGCVLQQPGEVWKCQWRFRYYAGTDDPFDQTDKKSWYVAKGPGREDDRARLVDMLYDVAQMTADNYGGEVHVLVVAGSGIDAMAALAEQPWAYGKLIPDPTQGGEAQEVEQ